LFLEVVVVRALTMRDKASRFLLALVIASTCLGWAGESRTTRYEDKPIYLYRADPAELSLHWKGPEEKPLRLSIPSSRPCSPLRFRPRERRTL